MIDSRCGLHCTGCPYKTSHGCQGCIETKGNQFHGECEAFPCELLERYSCDPEHGDTPPGARIEQCRSWKTE